MIYIVDIDGTICSMEFDSNGNVDYAKTKPYMDRIAKINKLFDEGHEIHYYTARGSRSGIDRTEITHKQMADWGAKYTSLQLRKPHYDLWIDDKSIHPEQFFK